jgi:hypothetical protein
MGNIRRELTPIDRVMIELARLRVVSLRVVVGAVDK